MRNIFLMIFVVMLSSACSSIKNQSLTPEAAAAIKGKIVIVTLREKPNFSAMTPVNVQFGLLGAAAAVANGNSMINENAVDDPARTIQLLLSNRLVERHGAKLGSPLLIKDESAELLARQAKERADYVLDVQTLGWNSMYYPISWGRYKVMYSAMARIIDTRDSRVIAQGSCFYDPEKDDSAPTWDELVDNKAKRLKEILARYSQQCADSLDTVLLSPKAPT